MIIKLTVHDNDFTERVEAFSNHLFDKLYWYTTKKENETLDEAMQRIKYEHKVQSLMNVNITENLSKEDKKFICDIVKKLWEQYIDELTCYDDYTKDYLKRNFKSSISYRFKDAWQNRENVYYFTVQQKYLTQ